MRLFWLFPFLALAACAASPEPTPPPVGGVGMANPASVHCEKVGGTLEMRDETGGVAGYCHLPDGRVVEEWELFRADNPPQ